jgi:hypothetical protein
MAYCSISRLSSRPKEDRTNVERLFHPLDPQLVCTEKKLPANIEQEIKKSFFELKPKFEDQACQVYISHIIL